MSNILLPIAVQIVAIVAAFFVAHQIQKNRDLHTVQSWSYLFSWLGTIVGIGSVTEARGISLSGFPPVILIWKYGPQIGVGLLFVGFILQMVVHEKMQTKKGKRKSSKKKK